MQTGLEALRQRIREDKRNNRRLTRISVLIFIVIVAVVLCMRMDESAFVTPKDTIINIYWFIRLKIAEVINQSIYNRYDEIIADLPLYQQTVSRLRDTLLMIVCGMVLALSGTIYQASMRNAMAVPTMLGVTSGVQLAYVFLVLTYAEEVYMMTTTKYIYCYGFSIGILLVVIILGALVGGRRFSVVDMLLVGTIISRIASAIVNYARSQMDDDTLEIFQNVSQTPYESFNSFKNLGILCLVIVIALLPVFLMRFSFNTICFDDMDAKTLGMRPILMRVIGLISGGVLVTAAQIHCGDVGMLSLFIPHVCRYLYGSNFKTLFYASALYGSIFLIISRGITSFIHIQDYTVPLGNVLSLLAIPVLVWVMLKQRRGWE